MGRGPERFQRQIPYLRSYFRGYLRILLGPETPARQRRSPPGCSFCRQLSFVCTAVLGQKCEVET